MTHRIILLLFFLGAILISISDSLRVREGGDQEFNLRFGNQRRADTAIGSTTVSFLLKNITAPPHNTSGDDAGWGQGGLADSSSDSSTSSGASDGPSELSPGNNTLNGSTDSPPQKIGTSAFLFVSIPLIALAAAIASKYGKSSSEIEASRNSHDPEEHYSTHRMITAASEEEEEGSISPDVDDRDCQDMELIRRDNATSESVTDRKLFVQVYKPHRNESELAAIKNGLAIALNDRGSPAIRGSGRYNLKGRSSYTPDGDSAHNSPFDEPSMSI